MKQQRRHLEARHRQFVRRVIRGSSVLFLICALSAVNLSVSRAAATASLVASPATAVQGERIGVTGSGFRAGEGIIFYWSGALLPETTTASSGGSFSNVLISIPLTATHGSHPLVARGKASGLTGITGVTVPAPEISAAPTSAVPGQAIRVTGSGFRAGEAIIFFVNGQLLPETTIASSVGSFSNAVIGIPLTATRGTPPLVARGKASGLNGIATLHVEGLPSTSTPRPIVAPTQTPLATQPPAPISTPGVVPNSVSASLAGTAGTDGWYRSAVVVTLNTTPATGVVAHYQVDNGPLTTYGGPFSVGSEGHHVVTYSATGSGGTTALQTLNLALDGTPPTTSSSIVGGAPTAAGWYNQPVSVQLAATDATSGVAATYYQRDNQGAFTLYSGPLTVDAPGTRLITYYSVDHAGNQEAPKQLSLRLDRQAPTTTATLNGAPQISGAYTTQVAVDLRAADDLSGVAATNVTVDGVATRYSAPILLTTAGMHVVTYYSVDAAGNVEPPHRLNIPIVAPAPAPAPTATRIPVAPRPPVTRASTVHLSSSAASVGWDRTFRLTVHTTPASPRALVQILIRTDPHRANWRIIRTALLSSHGSASWVLRTRQSAAYEAIVLHTRVSPSTNVRVYSLVTLRRVPAKLPGQVLLSGHARPELSGHMVALQVAGPRGTWRTLATTALQSRGSFVFATPVDRKKTFHWRVWDPPTAGIVGHASNTVTLAAAKRH